MYKPQLSRAYFQLHLAILLFGFSAILGKLIQLPGMSIVWYRMLFTFVILSCFPGLIRKALQIPRKAAWRMALIGALMSLHWITFFESIKYGNVSITLSALAATALFTAFIEPFFFKKRIQGLELILAAFVLLGFVCIFGFVDGKYVLAICLGIASAMLIAIAGVLNKSVVGQFDVMAITWIEFLAGFLTVSALMPFYRLFIPALYHWPGKADLIYLLLLVLLCTIWGYILMMKALRWVSAFNVMLSMNLEPIYGMLMAAVCFKEYDELNGGFYLGSAIILLAVGSYPFLLKSNQPTEVKQKFSQKNSGKI